GTRFMLLKQPAVLDGNDSLASESFEQFDVSVKKRTHFHSPDVDHPDRSPFSEHRRAKKCPQSTAYTQGIRKFLLAFLQIGYVQGLSRKNGSTRGIPRVIGLVSRAARVPNDAAKRVTSPSTRRICASVASHNRAAFSATVSNTG